MVPSLTRLRALLVATALAAPGAVALTTAPAVAAPNVCTNDDGYYWSTEQDMLDAYGEWCRETYVDDPGIGQLLSRDRLLSHADLYARQGFDRQWLWYAPGTTMHVGAWSPQEWTDCPHYLHGIGGVCPTWATLNHSTISGADFGGRAVDLHVFAFGGKFVGRACGNASYPANGGDPVPTITGRKFDDRNRNGTQDAGEPGLGGWTFQLIRESSAYGDQAPGYVGATTTDGGGGFTFALAGVGPGTYTVREVPQPGWTNTTGTSRTVVVSAGVGNATVADLRFGNRAQHPPIADAGPAQTLDQSDPAGAPVTLDGSASRDPDGDPLSYTWTGPFGTATGVSPTVHMPVGTSRVTLVVNDGLASDSATTTVTVYPPITVREQNVAPVEGLPFTGVVATFTDPDPAGSAEEYTATVDWGDGSPPTTGTIAGEPGGTFTVTGGHTYAEEGNAPVTVTVTDADNAFNSGTVTATAAVADAPLSADAPPTVTGTEGSPLSATVATFTDANRSAPVGDFTATIDWGDGSAPTAGIVTARGDGRFAVSGTHLYVEEGSYRTTVHVTDEGGSTATASGSAVIADAALEAAGVHALSTNPVNRTVATFTDANPYGPVGDFTATIDWGDGSAPTAGTVSGDTGGPFSVSGSHSYATLGPKTITVHIVDDGGSTATAVSRVLLYGLAAGGDFVIGDGNAAPGTHVTFWGAQWDKLNTLSGGPAPAAFKGFANGTDGTTDLTGWTTDPGDSSNPPATVPTYLAVVVAGTVRQQGSIISGDAPHVVIVRVDGGYGGNPGHAGTGTVVATLR